MPLPENTTTEPDVRTDHDLLAERVARLEQAAVDYGNAILKLSETIQVVTDGFRQFRDSPLPGSLGPRLDRIERELAGLRPASFEEIIREARGVTGRVDELPNPIHE